MSNTLRTCCNFGTKDSTTRNVSTNVIILTKRTRAMIYIYFCQIKSRLFISLIT